MLQFEFQAYRDGTAIEPETFIETYRSDSAARSKAGSLAKKFNGPVDLARAGGADWAERYMTTAMPDPEWKSGYRFERIES